ncbi:MAG TPA: MBL fold metallo-hydrolase [Solirubrobacteraceae bacterium]|jgi:glyoxylase-like metal-dependent hydrolase (beta-lactamase superfamily II)|nr:MBL fold metallo-hydrolase [Solirubrobacteraceae bacterium]
MRTPSSPAADGEEAGLTAEAPSPEARSAARLLRDHDVLWLRASNSGPVTLSGTNSWVVGREPAWVVDPGPLLDEHLEALLSAIETRGGLGGIVLTHDHDDHSEAVPALLARHPAPVAAGRGEVDVLLGEGARVGPFEAVATPGHADGHFALVAAGACFTGDAVLGEGSVFISPYPGAMAGYLRALTRLGLRRDLDVLCPGHGPPVWDPYAKLDEYVEHRLDRENRLIAALAAGRRTVAELLDAVWPDVPAGLRGLATVTLAAHLDKLADEHILPEGVERPRFERTAW